MLELIAKMKSDLEKLEDLVANLPIGIRTTEDGIKVQRVYRKAKAGDYVSYPKHTSANTLKDKLYLVIGSSNYLMYVDEEGDRQWTDGWSYNSPIVYEVVNDDA